MPVLIVRDNCPVCGGVGGEVRERLWKTCKDGRLVYQNLFTRLPEMEDLLAGIRRSFRTDKKINDGEFHFEEKRPSYTRRMKLHTKLAKVDDCVCEVGFGGSLILRLLREEGFQNLFGVEVVERYVLNAVRLGFQVYWKDLSTGVPSYLPLMDCVFGNEMTEHVERPVDFLKGVRLITKSGGKAAFSFAVPDGRKKLSPSEWQYWRKESIELVVKKAGWKIIELKMSSTTGFVWLLKDGK